MTRSAPFPALAARPASVLALALTLALALALAKPASSLAADHSNLEEGLPLVVEDAYPVAFGAYELQLPFRYERTRDDENAIRLEPRLEAGLLPNLQGRLAVGVLLGAAERTGSGNLSTELFYNFNTESLVLPALALSLRGEFPTGIDASGVEIVTKLIATKTLPGRFVFHRLHLNIAWAQRIRPAADERRARYLVVVGYQIRAGNDTMLLADFVREQTRLAGESANIFEIGLRRQLTPSVVLAAAAGAGVLQHSPYVRGTAGLQYTLPF